MPARKAAKLKPIFKDVVVSTAGDCGWSAADITRWVTQRGGRFAEGSDENMTTHLLCSPEQYRQKGPKVKAALKLGKKVCAIVLRDWLEDSINKNKKLPAKEYLSGKSERAKRGMQLEKAKAAKGAEEEKNFVNTYINHIYTDEVGFSYEVKITRDDEEAGIEGQKYILHLFESNATPHLYHFACKFYKKARSGNAGYYRPSMTCRVFHKELAQFKLFFEKKTGIAWEDRVRRAGTMGRAYFQYTPPSGGKPMGSDIAPEVMDEYLEKMAKRERERELTQDGDECSQALLDKLDDAAVPTEDGSPAKVEAEDVFLPN